MNQAGGFFVPTFASLIVIVAPLFGTASVAQAPLLDGQTVETTDFHGTAPDTTFMVGPVSSVVGAAVELTNFGWSGFLNIDFSDTGIVITAAADQPFGNFELVRFFDANGSIPEFTGVAINPANDYAGFDASRIFFSGDRIELNLTGLQGRRGQQISLDLTAGPATTATAPVASTGNPD